MLRANVTEHVPQSAEQRVAGLFAFADLLRVLSVDVIHRSRSSAHQTIM